ncbi:thiamine-phosphate kinase [Catenulispora subtropica]|uniref:Thiamine-monophosphate kinase n=1 Tax=Catenulispora subtropica TaxID=450798 RepID=A0ABN2RYB3_9ACTN
METIDDVGEFGLIARIQARLPLTEPGPAGGEVLVPSGDDAAVLAIPDGRLVTSTDLLLEGRHFRRDWSSARDVGHKAAAQNFSDIAAMGGVPTSLLLSLVLPGDLPVAWVEEFADGVAAECAPLGAVVAGGDLVRGDLITISVTVFGTLEGRAPVLRSGARPGDAVCVAGRLGWSAAGLELLAAGSPGAGEAGPGGSEADFLLAHRRPAPPYAAGPEAARAGATAMLDVSDGLLADLEHLAVAGRVAVDVESALVPIAPGLRLDQVLTGGEDHALVATFAPDAPLPAGWRRIGSVHAGPPAVTVDGKPWDGPGGFSHFGKY